MRTVRYVTIMVILLLGSASAWGEAEQTEIPEQALVTIKTYIISGSAGAPALSFPGFPRMSMAVLEETITDAEMFVDKLRSLYAFSRYQVLAVSSVRARQDAAGLWHAHAQNPEDGMLWNITCKDFAWNSHGRLQMMVKVNRGEKEFLASHVSVLPERSVVLGRFADEEMSEAIFAIVLPKVDVAAESGSLSAPEMSSQREKSADASYRRGLPPVKKKAIEKDISCDVVQSPDPDKFKAVSKMPSLIEDLPPAYPVEAKKAGAEGTVWVRALVGNDGRVVKACVLKSSGRDDFDRAAVEAASKYRYMPAKDADGNPIITWVSYRVTFVLE